MKNITKEDLVLKYNEEFLQNNLQEYIQKESKEREKSDRKELEKKLEEEKQKRHKKLLSVLRICRSLQEQPL